MTALDVPYFKQAMLGSCGPASLLMVLKYHRPELELNRLLEFRAWATANIFPFGMTESFGLALFAAKSGFTPLVLKEDLGFHMKFRDMYVNRRLFDVVLPILKLGYKRLLAESRSRGLEVVYGPIDLDVIERFVEKGLPPIVMVDQTGYAPDEDYRYGVLHWVVITGFEDDTVIINDPDLGPNLAVPRSKFTHALDLLRENFQTDRRLVVVKSDNRQARSIGKI